MNTKQIKNLPNTLYTHYQLVLNTNHNNGNDTNHNKSLLGR